jgi:hypothetical protein
MTSMPPLDYGRSFLLGRAPSNEVRFWVESRTRLIDEESGGVEDYLQVGSCKSENTFAEQELFHEDNYDFLPVFGPHWTVVFRRKSCVSETYRETKPSVEWWDGQGQHLRSVPAAEVLTNHEQAREATYRFAPLVAQVEISRPETRMRAIVEFPIKTMNTHRADNLYQVDSGPVALPDLHRHDCSADGLRLAYVAFNVENFADFVVEVPTVIEDGGHVYHFSERLTLDSVNRLLALPV